MAGHHQCVVDVVVDVVVVGVVWLLCAQSYGTKANLGGGAGRSGVMSIQESRCVSVIAPIGSLLVRAAFVDQLR